MHCYIGWEDCPKNTILALYNMCTAPSAVAGATTVVKQSRLSRGSRRHLSSSLVAGVACATGIFCSRHEATTVKRQAWFK